MEYDLAVTIHRPPAAAWAFLDDVQDHIQPGSPVPEMDAPWASAVGRRHDGSHAPASADRPARGNPRSRGGGADPRPGRSGPRLHATRTADPDVPTLLVRMTFANARPAGGPSPVVRRCQRALVLQVRPQETPGSAGGSDTRPVPWRPGFADSRQTRPAPLRQSRGDPVADLPPDASIGYERSGDR